MRETKSIPRVAVNVLLFRGKKILLGLRTTTRPMWSPPGGHLLKNETLIQCGRREVREETGLRIRKVRVGHFVNDRNFADNTHYLNIFLVAEASVGTPRNGEPQDFSRWNWFNTDSLPKPLYFNICNLLKRISIHQLRKQKGSITFESMVLRGTNSVV